jgi:hypothetical protein
LGVGPTATGVGFRPGLVCSKAEPARVGAEPMRSEAEPARVARSARVLEKAEQGFYELGPGLFTELFVALGYGDA